MKDPMYARNVTRHLNSQVTEQDTKEHTQMKSLSAVHCVHIDSKAQAN